MKIHFPFLMAALLGFMLLLGAPQQATAAEWETDIDTALARAKQEKRDVILVFRGPSSNPICKQMNEQVLDGLEFRSVIGIEFILCHALSPEDQPDDEKARQDYLALSKRFHLVSYPVFFLIDSDGHVYGKSAIPKSTAAELVRTIADLRPRKAMVAALLKAAELAKPDEREAIKAFSDALDQLGAEFAMTQYPEFVARVIELDPANEYGLKSFWEQRKSARELTRFNQIYASIAPVLWNKKSSAEMVELLDSTIEEHSMQGEIRQMMEFQKFRAWAKEKNYQKMLEAARAALAVAPQSNLAPRLEGMVKRAEELLAGKAANPGEVDDGEPGAIPTNQSNQDGKTPEPKPTLIPETEPEPEPEPAASPSDPAGNAAAAAGD